MTVKDIKEIISIAQAFPESIALDIDKECFEHAEAFCKGREESRNCPAAWAVRRTLKPPIRLMEITVFGKLILRYGPGGPTATYHSADLCEFVELYDTRDGYLAGNREPLGPCTILVYLESIL